MGSDRRLKATETSVSPRSVPSAYIRLPPTLKRWRFLRPIPGRRRSPISRTASRATGRRSSARPNKRAQLSAYRSRRFAPSTAARSSLCELARGPAGKAAGEVTDHLVDLTRARGRERRQSRHGLLAGDQGLVPEHPLTTAIKSTSAPTIARQSGAMSSMKIVKATSRFPSVSASNHVRQAAGATATTGTMAPVQPSAICS